MRNTLVRKIEDHHYRYYVSFIFKLSLNLFLAISLCFSLFFFSFINLNKVDVHRAHQCNVRLRKLLRFDPHLTLTWHLYLPNKQSGVRVISWCFSSNWPWPWPLAWQQSSACSHWARIKLINISKCFFNLLCEFPFYLNDQSNQCILQGCDIHRELHQQEGTEASLSLLEGKF